MNRYSVVCLILFFIVFLDLKNCYAAGTYVIPGGSITLTSQDEVNNFAINLISIDKIDGDILFEDYDDYPYITDISCLVNIKEITGTIEITDCSQLNSVVLNNLEVAGGLKINYGNSIVNFSLNGLTEVENDFYIHAIVKTNINLNNLIYVGGECNFSYLSQTEIINCINLKTVGGKFSVFNNPKLTSVDFNSITTVGNGFYVVMNGVDFNAANFNNLTTVNGTFYIWGNDGIKNISLGKLESVSGQFKIEGNDVLETISFNSLTTVGTDFKIYYLIALKSANFPRLESVNGIFTIYGNAVLENITYNNLSLVGKDLFIYSNTKLNTINFYNLISVGESLRINSNPLLKNIFADNLSTTGSNFYLYTNPLLGTLDFSNLTTVGSAFKIFKNYSLGELHFPKLSNIGGDFYLYKNDTLSNALYFENLKNIIGDFIVTGTNLIEDYIKDEYGTLIRVDYYLSFTDQSAIIDILNIESLEKVEGNFSLGNLHKDSELNWSTLNQVTDSMVISTAPDYNYCFLPEVVENSITLSKGSICPLITREDLENGFCDFNKIYFSNIIVKTQSEADALTTILEGKTQVCGDIYIGSPETSQIDPVTDLSAFENIERIKGSIHIGGTYNSGSGLQLHSNPALASLDGLENINLIANSISIEQNAFLADYCALSNFALSGNLSNEHWYIVNNKYNPTKEDIASDKCLSDEVYSGDIYIRTQTEMDALNDILEGISMIKGSVYIGSQMESPTDPVINLLPLKKIEAIKGNLYLGGEYNSGTGYIQHYNPSLLSLQGLGSLKQISKTFCIANNQGGLSFNGVDSLQIIEEKLSIKNNSSLLSLNGLESITVCDTIDISSNPDLDIYCALNILVNTNSYTTETWLVSDNYFNPSYEDMLVGKCSSNADVSHVHFGDIIVRTQSEMDNLSSLLNEKTVIAGEVYIGSPKGETSDPITEIKNFSEITYITGSLTIGGTYNSGTGEMPHQNRQLESLTGFDALEMLGTGFVVENNPELRTLDGFNELANINSHVQVVNNYFLYNFCSLSTATNKTQNTGFSWTVSQNLYNPTIENMENGDCSMDVSHIYFGDIIVRTQSEVNALQYELKSKTRVMGSVYIGSPETHEPDSIFDLSAFQNLETINGNLYAGGIYDIGNGEVAHYNTGISSLESFSNIASVGGLLSLSYISNITNLDGLSMLTTVAGGNVVIQNNPVLEDLCALLTLVDLGYSGGWNVSGNEYNPALNDMQKGICNLRLSFSYIGDIYVKSQSEMNALTSLLNDKKYIAGNVYVGSPYSSPSKPVVDFSPLNHIYEIDVDLWIGGTFPREGETEDHYHHNPDLEDLSGLNSLSLVSGELHISNNTSNEFSLNGFVELKETGGGLFIENNERLSSIEGLEKLTTIRNKLYIRNNPSLVNLNGLELLESVENLVAIENNAPLFSLCGLNNLINHGYNGAWSVSGNFYNPSLAEMQQGECLGEIPDKFYLGSLWITSQTDMNIAGEILKDSIGIVGNVYVGSKTEPAVDPVTDFSPINNIEHITGGLYIGVPYFLFYSGIFKNPELTSLEGLSELTTVGNLYVEGNPKLEKLTGLGNLGSINGDCYIHENELLNSLDGLEVLDSVTSVLYIHNNPSLSSLDGLGKLTTVGNCMDIWNNPSLLTLSGIDLLSYVGGSMYVRENEALEDFCALSTLFESNTLDENRWFAEGNTNNPQWEDILEGTYCFVDDSKGENSETSNAIEGVEVFENICFVNNDMLIVRLGDKKEGNFSFQLYDMFGRLVIIKNNLNITGGQYTIDVGALAAGAYIVKLSENNLERGLTSKVIIW